MYRVYQISSGDTLESIANKLNTTVDNIKELNGIEGDVILMPGSFIIIPNSNDYFTKYIVKQGDSIYGIAREYSADPKLILMVNGLNDYDYIYPDQEILIPNNNYKFYMTKSGDTLKSVVNDLKTNYETLLNNNQEIFLIEDQLIIYK